MIDTGYIIRGRYERNWSQRELADRIGITKDHMCRIECGKVNPRLKTIVALCEVLEIEPNRLIKWSGKAAVNPWKWERTR